MQKLKQMGNVMEHAGRSLAAFVLAAACTLGLLLLTTAPAQAASWMDPYLDQAVAWGVMTGNSSGDLEPERPVTRAEFVTMVNRAFGYRETGPTPFQDVPANAWYAEDIGIAYRAGYFTGTSATASVADPLAPVTREQAVVMLGRNMGMRGSVGAIQGYVDSQEIATWSRGMVQEATEMGIVTGYNGYFSPRRAITRGEAACMLVRSLGTLVQDSGEQSAGGVYGNLTINAPGVHLKDTVVTGNLYLTGGITVDDVVLENVNVMGKIVACGAGASQKGDSSIVLRNVTADGLVVDSLADQFISLRSEGLTDVRETTVRSSAYLEDLTEDGLGLQYIKLDGGSGTQLQLAGNIKEVINLTPGSSLAFGQGVANKVTVDERAIGATLNIDNSANLRQLNLDTGTSVIGTGDISILTVNADGTTVSMLPETITVRPGVTANINKAPMDSKAAAESSEDPRLLTGYPVARNVAPKTADAVFSTNKSGTVYWALTAMTDGSVDEEALVNPAAYSSKILKSGTIRAAASKTEMTTKLSGLTVDGSYYLSAILVDSRDRRSPVKVTSFTTPDDTTPNFSTGYPTTALTSDGDGQVIQATVMPTKDCQLYYALMPKGSAAPSAADFKATAVTGNLGFGVVDVRKNTPHLIPRVNNSYLAEQTAYDLYLWLNDADNGKSSAVKKVTVTTLDKTPPVIQYLRQGDPAARTITMNFALDEPGTLYWAVVKQGTQFYMQGVDKPEDLVAKIQVESGTNALKKGSSSASRAGADVRFTISGLEAQTAYDLYYVAKDRAGNYNIYTETLTPPMTVNTLDNVPPTVAQEFTKDGTENPQNLTPYPDTSIRLVFSESVQGIQDVAGKQVMNNFLELYNAAVKSQKDEDFNALADALETHIKLYYKPASGQPEQVAIRPDDVTADEPDWVIDYRKATVAMDPSGTGEMIITFPYDEDEDKSALNLYSGATYYFTLEGIADTSTAANRMQGVRGITKLQDFTTIDAQMVFSRGTSTGKQDDANQTPLVFDMNFRLTPVTAASVSDETVWDMLFWSSDEMEIELYYRDVGEEFWTKVEKGASTTAKFEPTTQNPTVGLSVTRELMSDTDTEKANPGFQQLNTAVDREYGIKVLSLNGSTTREDWSGTVSITVTPVAGDQGSMANLSGLSLTPDSYDKHQAGIYKVKEIGVPVDYTVSCPFRDKNPPTFVDEYPKFTPGDTGVSMEIMMNRAGTYYYVITKAVNIPTTLMEAYAGDDATGNVQITTTNWGKLPEDGSDVDGRNNSAVNGNVVLPVSSTITRPSFSGSSYVVGHGTSTGAWMEIPIANKLESSSKYIAYFVLQGESQESISNVYAFRFETEEVVRPILNASQASTSITVISDRDATAKGILMVNGQEPDIFKKKMSTCWEDNADIALEEAEKTRYQGLTVLQAMQQHHLDGATDQGSVFDLFADANVKTDMVNFFVGASQADGVSITKVVDPINLSSTTRPPLTKTQDYKDGMKPGRQTYNFVVMGQSPLGSGYAFAATLGLFYPDNTPPQVTTLSTSRNENVPVYSDAEQANNHSYSGTVYIGFSTPLYYNDNGTYKQVVDKPIGNVGSDYASSAIILNPGKGTIAPRWTASDGDYPCETLTINYAAAMPGDSISFSSNLSNSRGITGETQLTITLTLVKDANGLFQPRFVVTSRGWGNPTVT